MSLESIRDPPRGRHGKNIKKIFFSETTRPRAFILMCSGPLYKSCQPCPWGQKMAPPRGSFAPIDMQWEKHKTNLLLQNHKAQSFHILCVAMYSGPLYKSCQPCPWGPYGPCPRVVMGKTLKKSSSPKPQGPELSCFVCSNVWWSSL